MKTKRNILSLKFPDHPVNVPIAKCAIRAFVMQANPTIETLNDITTAVEEAVSNAVEYAYPNSSGGEISVRAVLYDDNTLEITVRDKGIGIKDIEKARSPLYTSSNGDCHVGLGFSVMENFMDSVSVRSNCFSYRPGTTVILKKELGIKPIWVFPV